MKLNELLQKKILILEGAMGTKVGVHQLSDLLNLTSPHLIESIHEKYVEAGADIIKTNTFNANRVSLEKHGLVNKVGEINKSAVEIAQKTKHKFSSSRPIFIAGVVGPTSSSATGIQGFSTIEFHELVEAYKEQIHFLINGQVDLLLLETFYDQKNLEAALKAISGLNHSIPVMVSITISPDGKLLSGETVDEFLAFIKNYTIFSLGLNCSFGAEKMTPALEKISQQFPSWISVHPNAGLPTGKESFMESMELFMKKKWVNIVGGCCGTDEVFIKDLSEIASKISDVRCP